MGWLTGPEVLISSCRLLHAYTSYCAPTPLQLGVAEALDKDTDPETGHGAETSRLMSQNAADMSEVLRSKGLEPFETDGGYFLVADVSSTGLGDFEFCERLVKHAR